MSQSPDSNTPKRGKKACTECRQQKVRCNADPPNSCTRCKKMNLECVIIDSFERKHKRKRLSELEQETAALKQRLALETHDAPKATYNPTPYVAPGIPAVNGHNGPSYANTNGVSQQYNHVTPVSQANPPDEYVTPLESADDIDTEPTQPRELAGTYLAAPVIDHLFALYFDKFAPFMPILDPKVSPNVYYKRSEFVFWAIIVVASRSYPQDPALRGAIAPRVVDLALSSMKLRSSSLHGIQGIILLLTWPLPRNVPESDVHFPLVGALMHMAMQISLHAPLAIQEFAKGKLKLTESDVNQRTKLWGYCILAYQRSCNKMGIQPLQRLDVTSGQDPEQLAIFHREIPQHLRFQLKLQRIVRRCSHFLTENGLRKLDANSKVGMNIILRIFESEVKDLEPQATTPLEVLYYHTTLLNVRVYNLFKDISMEEAITFTNLFVSCCNVLDHLEKMLETDLVFETIPAYFAYGLLMASTTLLRLLKSSFSQVLDVEKGKASYFAALNICRRLTRADEATAMRLTSILSQLWNSDRVFKAPDGSEYTALRIRSRLSMSGVYDVSWWHKEEFKGQAGAFPLPGRQSNGELLTDSGAASTTTASNELTQPDVFQETFDIMDEQFLAEFGLPFADENLLTPFAPAEIFAP